VVEIFLKKQGCVKVGVAEYIKTGNGQLNINSKLAFLI
jgi:hypothetical protein